MKIRRNGNKLLHDDISSPELVVAEFPSGKMELTTDAKRKFVIEHNFGVKMLDTYMAGRGNMHISYAAVLLENLEAVFREYNTALYAARREEDLEREKLRCE